MNIRAQLFQTGKVRPLGWPVLGGAMIVASFIGMMVIWQNVNRIEQVQLREHEVLMDHIAQSARLFLREGQLDYFYRTLTLLTRISFIKNITVYQNRMPVLQAGTSDRSQSYPRSNLAQPEDRSLRYLRRQLMENDPQETELKAAFSLHEAQEPKRAIRWSFAMNAGLLLVMGFFSSMLYYVHRRLRETERIKTHMIDSINHDASHDLTIIHSKLLQITKQLKQPMKPVSMEKDLKSALESTESMVRFLNNLKDQKRLGTGNVELLVREVDLALLIQTVADNFREKLNIRKMTLKFEKPEIPPVAWADPQIVKRVLTNLVHNAIKYSLPGTTVTLTVERRDGWIHLMVQDQGVGLEEKHWQRIFEPYWQVNPDSPGIGLGLYIARQFIRMFGGEMGICNSRMGEGTTFYFTLPECKPGTRR